MSLNEYTLLLLLPVLLLQLLWPAAGQHQGAAQDAGGRQRCHPQHQHPAQRHVHTRKL
jgi:hypothetical protein